MNNLINLAQTVQQSLPYVKVICGILYKLAHTDI